MTWNEAIVKVLAENGKSMHYLDITQEILDKGYKTKSGATPAMTVSNQLTTNPDIFRRVGKGTYEFV